MKPDNRDAGASSRREDDTLKHDKEDKDLTRPAEEGEMRLPHEREEAPGDAADRTSSGPREVIDQAARDIGRGLRDTERRGVPSDVPGPGPAPDATPGAEVPPEGLDRTTYAPDQKSGDPRR